MQTGNFFRVNLDLFYFLGFFTFSRVKMPSSLAPGSHRINASSKKFSKNFDQKTIHRGSSHLMGVFYICLLGNSKVHFGFAVYEICELEHTMNSQCYCGHPTNFSTSLPIREREICVTFRAPCKGFDIFNPLSHKQYSTVQFAYLVELKFSSFSPTNFTDHHFAYYLALEKNIGALETKMNHALPLRTL